MSDENGYYTLGLAFDIDDPEFVRGFEAGLTYEGLQMALFTGATAFSRPIHATNAEMAMRIAERFDVEFSAEALDETFVQVRFQTKGQA